MRSSAGARRLADCAEIFISPGRGADISYIEMTRSDAQSDLICSKLTSSSFAANSGEPGPCVNPLTVGIDMLNLGYRCGTPQVVDPGFRSGRLDCSTALRRRKEELVRSQMEVKYNGHR